MITQYCLTDLQKLQELLARISTKTYSSKCALLSNATIGQHTRHILEFYGCLLSGDHSVLNYDDRKRSIPLESDPIQAIDYINQLCQKLTNIHSDQSITMINNLSVFGERTENVKTSLYRELLYCLEHSIHHKALIKVKLILNKEEHLVDERFGVAPSTLRNRMKAATDHQTALNG